MGDPGFPVGGVDLAGGVDSRGSYAFIFGNVVIYLSDSLKFT